MRCVCKYGCTDEGSKESKEHFGMCVFCSDHERVKVEMFLKGFDVGGICKLSKRGIMETYETEYEKTALGGFWFHLPLTFKVSDGVFR